MNKSQDPGITSIPPLLNKSYFPSLDGLRAVSIFIVLCAHLRGRYEYILPTAVWEYFFAGNIGVYVFFCISGFLITSLLLKEKLTTGNISLKNFYIRRFFRIIPVSILYLVLLFILNKVLHLNVSLLAFGAAFIYIINIAFRSQWFISHYWSLSVEEQFYLFFPFLVKKGPDFALRAILIIEVILLSIRILYNYSLFPDNMLFEVFRRAITNLDGVLLGALTAILVFKRVISIELFSRYNLLIKIGCILTIPLFGSNFIGFAPINSSITSILICVLLLCCLLPTNDFIFKILNWGPMKKIGVLSYSLYIFQQFFLVPPPIIFKLYQFKLPDPQLYKLPFVYFPYNIISLIVVAYLSYNYFEKPFLKLKDRFSTKAIKIGRISA